ncbi:MAG: hypothetical protein AB7E80_12670 [Hyphomicrobiaceae bacterium]
MGAAALLASACGQASTTRLPDVGPVVKPLMSPAEQQAAMRDLEARRSAAAAEARREIEARH